MERPPTVDDALAGAEDSASGTPARTSPDRRARSTHRKPNPPMGPLRRGVREVGLALITAGVVVLLFVAYQLVGTNFAEANSQHKLARAFRQEVAQPAHPPAPGTRSTTSDSPTLGAAQPGPGIPAGGALDHLVIPKIGLDKYVVEGVADNDLEQGPGHYPQTVLPGQTGNSAIAGHRTTYGAPFFDLNQLAVGDPIEITDTANQHFTYRVTNSLVVSPSDTAVLDNTPGVATLTLTTCNPRFSATSRLVVIAQLAVGAPLPAPPASHPTGVAFPQAVATVNLGSGSGKAWPPVILFGAIVLVGWVLVRLAINRTRRWARLGAYAVGIGVLLIPLWFLMENTARLLPQNI